MDGLLDRRLGLEEVDARRHSPVKAHWFYFFASLPWIACYSLIPTWSAYTLGVTFACGYVFTFSALAASRIPTRMKTAWKSSEVYRTSPALIRTISYIGFALGASMVASYLLLPQLGLTGTVPYFIVFGIFLFSWALYVLAKSRSQLVVDALETEPEEVEEFFKDDSQ